ncbi:MAG TPA: TonB-dependent receptor [Rhizomicrobium sp.]|nr:TonB-dependent receptor [Rhizomicrobium sp.]
MIGLAIQNSGATRLTGALLCGTALAGIVSLSPALAQSDVSASNANTIETVTVTAQRRSQDILDVPYNISAVSGETIEQNQILDTAELMRGISGVSVVDRGDRNASVVNGIRIRGLNVDSSALGDYAVSAASTVSTYVNDTPIFANFLLKDIARVEVLKGPQGTLYGSGALGGTVRYVLNAPQLDSLSGSVSVTGSHVGGSDGAGYSVTGILNVPVDDTLAVRVSGTRYDYPGITDSVNLYKLDSNGIPVAPNGELSPNASYYSKKDTDYARGWNGRVAVLWKPTENFDVTASFMGQSDQYGGRRVQTLGTDGYGRPYQSNESGNVLPEPGSRDVYLTSLEANLDLGFATLTSSTSYYNHHGDLDSDNTGFYAQNGWYANFYYNYPRPASLAARGYGDKAFVEEVRLVSEGEGPIDYVLGLYYSNQQTYSFQNSYLLGFKQWWDAAYPGISSLVSGDQDWLFRRHERYVDKAVYGEVTWHITDTVQLTGGMRYFDDSSHAAVHMEFPLWVGLFPISDSEFDTSKSKPIFKGNASWTFMPENMVYTTISQGYRRGGTNGTPTSGYFYEDPAWLTYKPDSVVNYEVGAKGKIDNIVYNVDLFYVDWSDPQLNTSTTNWGFFAVQNGSKATTKGIEAQVDAYTGNWHYGLGYTYTEATLGADLYAADGTYLINTKGASLPGAPKHVVNGAVDYSLPFEDGTAMFFHIDGYYQSSALDTAFSENVFPNSLTIYPPPTYLPVNSPFFGQPKYYDKMPGFMLWNISSTYSFGKWNTTLWVKNLFNADGVTGVYTEAYMGPFPAENYYGNASKALISLPRTVGVTVNYKF